MSCQSFFRCVDRFNDSVKQEWLTDGFEEAELLYTKYDPYATQDEWTAGVQTRKAEAPHSGNECTLLPI